MALKIYRRVVQVTEVDDPDLHLRIEQAQKKSGLNVSEVCRRLGLSRTYWYKIVNDNVRDGLSEATLRKIEEILDVDLGVKFDA